MDECQSAANWGLKMKQLVFSVAAFATLGAMACSPAPTAQDSIESATAPQAADACLDPVTMANAQPIAPVIEAIYAPYAQGGAPSNVRWSQGLTAMFERVEASAAAQEEEMWLDMDIYTQSQDSQLGPVTVTDEGVQADCRWLAVARFTNFGAPTTVYYDLVFDEGAWTIDDVRTDDWGFRSYMDTVLAPG